MYIVLNLSTINFYVALGGLALLGVTMALYVDHFFLQSRYYRRFVGEYVWQIIIVITAASVALSLLYSEYFGFVPCSLCWLQRVALYPQALLAVMAFRSKDRIFFPLYGIGLSIFGLAAAVYQYIYQMLPKDTGSSLMPCLADGSADCAAKIIDEFGFVTFPLLAAVTFVFLIALYLNLRSAS